MPKAVSGLVTQWFEPSTHVFSSITASASIWAQYRSLAQITLFVEVQSDARVPTKEIVQVGFRKFFDERVVDRTATGAGFTISKI